MKSNDIFSGTFNSEEIGGQKDILILLAEDNPDFRYFFSFVLRKWFSGFKLMEAKNGEEAVQMCKKYRPDIIFMDLRMPEMDGLQAAGEIKRNNVTRHIPVVGFSAEFGEKTRDICLKSGMDDYVSKPLQVEDLKRVVARWIIEVEPEVKNMGEQKKIENSKRCD